MTGKFSVLQHKNHFPLLFPDMNRELNKFATMNATST